ncbi:MULTISPECIES: dTDP-4-dehydrorhamnose reductase [unclassified Bradyrhizobium]|uniref:dTDP-4-dehydrorhamnose reductase n=1 Tax=unclassified Bradyrhizobium TaxID=2631580 RepID=UPI0028EC6538|nr:MULTISPECIES: dTDP-4-dehydrorhamnose reductase [unclassified Bradyrhizobium]
MRLLVFGKNGQVGTELQRILPANRNVTLAGRSDADFSRPDSVRAFLADRSPDVIINAAAYTNVDRAEDEPEQARAINVDAVCALAEFARSRGIWLIHYSTDYVFDGVSSSPYVEMSKTNPLGVYGLTKRQGEIAIEHSGCQHLIFRTTWLHAPHGVNFIRTILQLARVRDHLRIVADQIGSPTGADIVANVTARALEHILAREVRSGIYHLSCTGATTWYGYARYLLEVASRCGEKLACSPEAVVPITSADYGSRARRPLNSRLDSTKLIQQFGVSLPDWRAGVERTVHALIEKMK